MKKVRILGGIVESGGVLQRSPLALAVGLVTAGKDQGGDAEA